VRPAFRIRLPLFLMFWCLFVIAKAQESVLRSGSWSKLAIEKNGIYKINYDLLKKMGFDPAKIDPRKIKIFGQGGGMLPQPNSSARPHDLVENAIYVQGESDGKFDKQDFLLFYAEGPDEFRYDVNRDIFFYQNNLYSDRNYYFLTVSEDTGKRMGTSENKGTGFPVIREFNDFVYYEQDMLKLNDPKSGREWYGEKFGISTNQYTFPFTVSGIRPGSSFKMVSSVLSQSYTNSSFKVSVNGVFLTEQNIPPIPNTRYGVKAIHKRDTLQLDASALGADTRSSHDVKYEFIKDTGASDGYLDFFLLNFNRSLALYNNQTFFVSGASLAHPVSQFEIASVPAGATIWDITDPADCKTQNFSLNGGTATFSTPTDQLKEFLIFTAAVDAPTVVGKIDNQNLHGLSAPNLIIVTHPLFKNEALRLAAHRQAFSGWTAQVVTPEEIFNEFSSGRQDVTAIRDFVKHLYDKNPASLKALLLFGKCSYDFKDRSPGNTNFVITYESRNSLHPLQTFSSDDYFAFMEDHEGEWREDPAQHHTMDIGVGRLPVMTPEEAKNCVDKIIDYDTNKKNFGSWRKQIVFVADDGNGEDGYTILHQSQADQLAGFIEQLNPAVDTRKLFMGSYAKEIKANREVIPKLTNDIIRAFDRGSLIINYTGHGSEKQWGDENVFNNNTIQELENKVYPFMVTATCEFGRHDNPNEISSAELAVIQKEGGVIGLVTTARPVNATTNFNLNQAFYEALFERQNGRYPCIGEVFRKTKNNSTNGVANRNFSLLGDPSLTLALPADNVQLTEIKTASGSDTLKALSTVIAKGEIQNFNGDKLSTFNGNVEITLFDKETDFVTIGKNDPPFEYSQWHNALFRGKATVIEGAFQLEFVMPKNIDYAVAPGKMSLYAMDPVTAADAIGSASDFKIGESEPNPLTESNPPQIRLFMGDTTFVNGGITTPDTWLVAHLADDTGINISSYGIGNNVMAILDDNGETFILNDYYVASQDDASSGWIHFPIKDLTPGRHRLTLKAWDIHDNSAEASIDFVVTDGESLVIETFGNYPNPFRENTILFFTHNRSGDDLQAQVFIHDLSGAILQSQDITITESDYKVDLLQVNSSGDFGKKLSAGLYLARLIVRSLTNGSKNEQVTKLIIFEPLEKTPNEA
jgi:hypothetical protein